MGLRKHWGWKLGLVWIPQMHLCLSQSFAVSHRYCTQTHTQCSSTHYSLSFFLNTHTHVSLRRGLCVTGEKEKKPLTARRLIGLSQTIFRGSLTRRTLCPVPFPKKNPKQSTGSRAAETESVPAVIVALSWRSLVFFRPSDIQALCLEEVVTLMKRPVDLTLLGIVSNWAKNCFEVVCRAFWECVFSFWRVLNSYSTFSHTRSVFENKKVIKDRGECSAGLCGGGLPPPGGSQGFPWSVGIHNPTSGSALGSPSSCLEYLHRRWSDVWTTSTGIFSFNILEKTLIRSLDLNERIGTTFMSAVVNMKLEQVAGQVSWA